ncbi:hypothetical protein [Gordonia iterans]
MIATLSVDRLLAAAARVGVDLAKTATDGNLYLWHTPEQEVVYIGKSASDKRVADERSWCELDPSSQILSGIVTLLRVNRAELTPLLYDPDGFDASRWRALIAAHQWEGSVIDALQRDLADRALTAVEVEKLLIRIGVRYGTPLGNAWDASQWEGPIGKTPDTLAAIAVLADQGFNP